MTESRNLWGGRFTGKADENFVEFNRSFGFDRRLVSADIRASVAHCNALEVAGVLSATEAQDVRHGLAQVLRLTVEDPGYLDDKSAEDVHSFVEARLVSLIGDAGRKLHTGRSRNDQVATDFRLWLRDQIDLLSGLVRDTQSALVTIAGDHITAVIPGYTHLQRAQPVLFAHWCLAYFEMLKRDRERLADASHRVNILPLGSAALAGTAYNIDRDAVAKELGFNGVSSNSLDAVSDRDFCVEFCAASSLIMVHLSRLAEDIILYASAEFKFLELSDAVATGSSLMPQKKNPDSMELVRGKAGRVFGHNMALLSMLKGLPLAYNKDMQEDKEAVFDTVDTVAAALRVTVTVLRNIRLNEARTRQASASGYMNATELAGYLVSKGLPFREAHDIVGRAVLRGIELGLELHELPVDELKSFSAVISDDVYAALSLEQTLGSKNQRGGTSPGQVSEALQAAIESLDLTPRD